MNVKINKLSALLSQPNDPKSELLCTMSLELPNGDQLGEFPISVETYCIMHDIIDNESSERS